MKTNEPHISSDDKRVLAKICDRYGVHSLVSFAAQMVAYESADIHFGIETRIALNKIAKILRDPDSRFSVEEGSQTEDMGSTSHPVKY